MSLSPAQIARNRLGGKVRQNPGADVTGLRAGLDAVVADRAVDDPAALARAAAIVRTALARGIRVDLDPGQATDA